MNLRVHSWYCTVFLPVTLVLVVLFCGVSRTQSLPAQSPRPALIQFTNVTAAAGIKFTHENLMDYAQCLQFEQGRFDILFGRDEILLGALALGATRWEAIRIAVLPYARAGILGATILGLGRALGETMAVTMVIGNSPTISASLFAPGYSLPAVIANEFAEASGALHTGALAALGLILFAVTLLLNVAARALVRMSTRGPSRAAS